MWAPQQGCPRDLLTEGESYYHGASVDDLRVVVGSSRGSSFEVPSSRGRCVEGRDGCSNSQ